MKIGIIGLGYVGKLLCEFFLNKHEIFIYDEAKHFATREQINTCDVAFICVPTESNPDGSCNTTIVETTVDWLTTPIIVIKSTVEPNTTKRLTEKTGKNIVFCPEYAGESSYWTPYKFHSDMKEVPFFIFGGNRDICNKLIDLYQPIAGPTKTYRVTDSTTAEMTKYLENCFYATKVAFCNEMFDLAKASNVSWNELRELWVLDPRMNPMHTLVFPDNRGFGGKCFPKDTKALLKYSEKMGSELTILKSVIESNDRIRKKE